MGNSYTPGRAQSPETLNSFRPVDFSVPMLLNHSGPLVSTHVTQAKVSTLLTIVGLPMKPVSMGKGGRLRGSPRCPSKRLDQGRFLAADVGPRAHADGDVEGEALLPGHGGPQQARVAAALQHGLQVRAKIGVFRAEVDDPVRRADDPRADGHAFEHQVGEVGQDHAVLERARLAFVGVADHVLPLARRLGGQFPLQAGGEAGAAPSPQPRGFAPCAGRRPGAGQAPRAARCPASIVLNVS